MDFLQPDHADRPEWAFHTLMRAHRVAHCAVFERLGLRDVGQPMLLFVLDDARRDGRECTQKGLCSALRLSASTVTASVKSLERHGYVRRRTDDRDMRRNIVEITDSGSRTAQLCRRAFSDIEEAMYSGFSVPERQQISELFARMADNLFVFSCADNSDVKEVCKCSESSSNL